MQITFNLPHVFSPQASSLDNANALKVLLNCLVDLNSAVLVSHAFDDLYRCGVRYGRTKLWEPIPALYARGYGDCKSLTAARIAQYRRIGIPCEPVFRWSKSRDPKRFGQLDYHIYLYTDKGYEDPSIILGMPSNETQPLLMHG